MPTKFHSILALLIWLHTYEECFGRALTEDKHFMLYPSNLIYGHIINKVHRVINKRKLKNRQTFFDELDASDNKVSSSYEQRPVTVRSVAHVITKTQKYLAQNQVGSCVCFKEFNTIKALLNDVKKQLLNMENGMKDVTCIIKPKKHRFESCSELAQKLKDCKKNHRMHRDSYVEVGKSRSYNGFSPWTPCSSSCGTGRTLRMRCCNEMKCDGADIVIEERLCHIADC